jgi:5-(carboxyamino)imidazole ribonucleotide synthase
MLAFEARRMGYRIVALDPDPESPAAQVSDRRVVAALDDVEAAEQLAKQCDVVTLDTEHIPSTLLERLERIVPVRPSAAVLRIVQDRLEQRRFLDAQRAAQVRYAAVESAGELHAAVASVGVPAVLKTRRSGYDGKGQVRIGSTEQVAAAWQAVGRAPAILEEFVEFDREISVLLARDLEGNVCFYPIAENLHRRHVLWTSRVPARVSTATATAAQQLASHIAAALGHVGMLALELFVTRDGALLVNEIAPRTHNSGHFSLGACVTSQFEQHVRAICGLALGDPSLLRPAVMLNLLGDLWQTGVPRFGAVLSQPNVHLHLYGKQRAYPGRKMGHVLVLDDDLDRAYARAEAIAGELERT